MKMEVIGLTPLMPRGRRRRAGERGAGRRPRGDGCVQMIQNTLLFPLFSLKTSLKCIFFVVNLILKNRNVAIS